jgi:23S rRNA (adenine2030-N6)-methyltransferase
MNYRHIYHAGNFADVAKHVALLYCLQALCRKEAPFFVLDTHAGRGYYELQAAEAAKSGEAERGIQRLITNASGIPAGADISPGGEPLQDYFTAIRARRGKRLQRYPGSPVLIAECLRAQDRAIFVEMLPAEARTIERELQSAGRIFTQIEDGYTVLKAQLPPPERRGLVLIDPPYESVEELKALVHAFVDAHARWPTGTFLMWYPIRSAVQRSLVHARFEALKIPKILYADLAIHPDDAGIGLAGSGMMIVNPPYGADDYLREAYAAIHRGIAADAAGYVEVARLTPERMAQ